MLLRLLLPLLWQLTQCSQWVTFHERKCHFLSITPRVNGVGLAEREREMVQLGTGSLAGLAVWP